jgi:hypothetical protein
VMVSSNLGEVLFQANSTCENNNNNNKNLNKEITFFFLVDFLKNYLNN